MLKPVLNINPKNHIFKTAGAVIGIIAMGFFGLIFGIIGGALIDQIRLQLRRKNELKTFLIRPESISSTIEGKEGLQYIEAAAIATAAYLCFEDPAKMDIINSLSQLHFPGAPINTAECINDQSRPDFRALASIFGSKASAKQKGSLNRLINSAGLKHSILRVIVENPNGTAAEIITAADFLSSDDTGTDYSDDYSLLGLEPEASKEEIKRVYYKLASHFHPDAGSELTPEQQKISEDAFKKIKDAYERIK